MKRISLEITVAVRSPFLFPGLEAGKFGLDSAAIRDRHGKPIIPMDQVRGVLRHAVADLRAATGSNILDDDDVRKLFGFASGDALEGEVEELPGRRLLYVPDLIAHDFDGTSSIGNRVRIDEETGAAAKGALMFVECVAPLGQDVAFRGVATLFALDGREKRIVDALRAATSYVSSMGAMKSAGYGEIRNFKIAEIATETLSLPTAASPSPARVRISGRFDRPLLIDSRRVSDNVHTSSSILPGAAIKGALAQAVSRAGGDPTAMKALTDLRIGHARVKGSPRTPPKSLVKVDDQIGDALDVPLGKGALIGGKAALFQPDWKDSSRKKGLRSDPRMHVAIDRMRGAGEDQKLFLTVLTDPGDELFEFEIDFTKIDSPEDAACLWELLQNGLDGIGGTNARLEVVDHEPSDPYPVQPVFKGNSEGPDRYAVTLETDAVIVSEQTENSAFDAYSSYWQETCPGAKLVNFFASQRLAGGYVGMRFRDSSGSYRPFLLTEAGSVFLLEGNIAKRLAELVADGLPAPFIGGAKTTWESCPYQPENGFGEIRADYDAALRSKVTYV